MPEQPRFTIRKDVAEDDDVIWVAGGLWPGALLHVGDEVMRVVKIRGVRMEDGRFDPDKRYVDVERAYQGTTAAEHAEGTNVVIDPYVVID